MNKEVCSCACFEMNGASWEEGKCEEGGEEVKRSRGGEGGTRRVSNVIPQGLVSQENVLKIMTTWCEDYSSSSAFRVLCRDMVNAAQDEDLSLRHGFTRAAFKKVIKSSDAFWYEANEQIWGLTPGVDKLAMIEKVTERSLAVIEREEHKWGIMKARRLFLPKELRRRFDKWKEVAHLRKCKRVGREHFVRRYRKKTLAHISRYTKRRLAYKEAMEEAGDRYCALLERHGWRKCLIFLKFRRDLRARAIERAESLYKSMLMEKQFKNWRMWVDSSFFALQWHKIS